jgi:hypothetical protein
MKGKKVAIWIGILLLCVLLISPGLSVGNKLNNDVINTHPLKEAVVSQDPPVLEIQDIKGGIGVSAYLHNVGTGNATNVSWNIVFNGGLILFGRQSPDTIPGIDTGTAVFISSGFVFGFGRCTITFTATCSQGVSTSTNATGTVLGFFVLGVK